MLRTRAATPEDAALVAQFRKAMFRAMGRGDDVTLDAMRRNFIPWVEQRLAQGIYLGWIAEDGDRPVATAGLFIMDWPPHATEPGCKARGYLLNVYVEPEYRGRGLATDLTRLAMDECDRRGIGVITLHASDAGRPIYEGLGFTASNEMMRRK